MKKILTVVIALVFIISIFSIGAYADNAEIDLSEYSLEELLALYNAVRTELSSRLDLVDNNSLIGRGTYDVGKDIKAGTYVLTIYETDYYNSFDPPRPNNSITIYLLDENGEEGSRLMWETGIPVGEHIVISLSEGQRLKISGCVCTIAVSEAVWAP